MTILKDSEIKKLSKLSRIAIDDNFMQEVAPKIEDTIAWIKQLEAVDETTENIEIQQSLRLMPDVISQEKSSSEEILKNSQYAKYGYFSVPKVIE